MRVLVVNPRDLTLEQHEIPSLTIVDGMFVKELGLTPLAYVYKKEHEELVKMLLNLVKTKKEELKRLEEEVWFKRLPSLRADK